MKKEEKCFKVGDLVQLKSGSPTMTASGVGHDEIAKCVMVVCTWFERGGLRVHSFNPFILRKVSLEKENASTV